MQGYGYVKIWEEAHAAYISFLNAKAWDDVYSNYAPENLPWNDLEFRIKVQQFVQPYIHLGTVPVYKAYKKIALDYGSGHGQLARVIDASGLTVLGADCSKVAVDMAKQQDPNPSYIQASDASNVSEYIHSGKAPLGIPESFKERGGFDLITCVDVLDYMVPMKQIVFLDGLKDLLNEEGVLCIIGHDRNDIFSIDTKQSCIDSEHDHKNCKDDKCKRNCQIKSVSQLPNGPIYAINSLESASKDIGLKVIESKLIEYTDEINQVRRQLRAYAMIHR